MPDSIIDELKNVSLLLQKEKEDDFIQFKNAIESLSLDERRKKGYTWFPVQTLKTGFTYGDRAFLTIQYNKELKAGHAFRSGKLVRLYSDDLTQEVKEKRGVIHYVNKNKMKIILYSKDLPDWIHNSAIGVDILFDESSYKEMEHAMETMVNTSNTRLADLRDVMLGKVEPKFDHDHKEINLPQLNATQNDAVNNVLSAQDLSIIHGPPGTGKTTTLVAAIKELSKKETTILVTAPSNAAVDLLTAKLAAKGLEVLRIGNISRIDEEIIMHTLDAKLSSHPESKNIKKVKIEVANLRKQAGKFKRNFGHKEREERKHLYQQSKELSNWVNQLEDRLIEQLINSAQVIATTLVGSQNRVIRDKLYKTVFIDEATQGLEPACWIPIIKAEKVVLAGDPFQLPPTVKSNKARIGGLGITLLEKCINRHEKVNLLGIQYRMNKVIMGFSNLSFYENKLKADPSNEFHALNEEQTVLEFIDTAGCSFEEYVDPEYHSKSNKDEVNILLEHLYQLDEKLEDIRKFSIGIISPYKHQVMLANEILSKDVKLEGMDISINTIDSFQGQERDIIYISLVRSNDKNEIGFLKDYRRMNVALTRAKKKLVVIGDSATIGVDDFYNSFLTYVEKEGAYRTAWEFMSYE